MVSLRRPLISALLWASAVGAAEWSSTNLQYLYGANFELGDGSRGTITLEHVSGWTYGDNFFFLDITNPVEEKTRATSVYGQWNPRLSLSKLTGTGISAGPIGDLLITGELGFGGGVREYLYGAGLDLKLPGFAYFAINFWVRDDASIDGITYQISPYWMLPIDLGPVKLQFGGFLDFAGPEGEGESRKESFLITQPYLLLDIGNFAKSPGMLFMGVEYAHWTNEYGIKGINENVPQAMVKWIF